MKKTRTTLPLSALLLNEGQLDWLPRNPRTWTKEDVERTAKSIAEDPDFLEDRPVLAIPFQDGKYIVFGGNLRREGSKAAGRKDVPAVVYVPETDEDRTTILRRAMKDNGSFGSWDYDALANEWDDLPLADFGIPVWDFSHEQGKDSGEGSGEGSGKVTEDDFDEEKDGILVRCQPGDVWELGEHRLVCGDSCNNKTFELLLEGKEARLCVTSPPYGVGKSYEEAGIGPWKKTIYSVIEAITKHARIIVWNIGDLFATGTQFIEPTSMYSVQKMKDCGFLPMYVRIWKKPGGTFASIEPYYTVSLKPVQEYEWILCFGKADYEKDYAPIIDWMASQAKIANLNNSVLKEVTGAGFMFGHWFTHHQWAMMDKNNYIKIQQYCKKNSIAAFGREYDEVRRDYDNLNLFGKLLTKEEESQWGMWAIWEMSTVNKHKDHPAEFPVELPARFIKLHSRPGDIILEPFCGSGTTLIAAEQLGRKCYGVELNPHYCDVIIARWEKATGKTAKKIE